MPSLVTVKWTKTFGDADGALLALAFDSYNGTGCHSWVIPSNASPVEYGNSSLFLLREADIFPVSLFSAISG